MQEELPAQAPSMLEFDFHQNLHFCPETPMCELERSRVNTLRKLPYGDLYVREEQAALVGLVPGIPPTPAPEEQEELVLRSS